jgi:methylenetetrahydrofolate dehydrogenase (NADP+)/methenyltetrahydrofolate cyclohydrolase
VTVLLDGKVAAEALRLKTLSSFSDHSATLAILVAGQDPRSKSYVKNKLRTAEKWRIKVRHIELSRSANYSEILHTIQQLNSDPSVSGIIFQLPPDLLHPLSASEIHSLIESIHPSKDADGLTSSSLGTLVAMGPLSLSPIPATPLGILRLLEHYNIPIEGKDVCILGKSRLVGMPLAILLEHKGATVTLCHSKTKETPLKARASDILIAATGVNALVKVNFTNPHQVLIDVGIVSTPEGIRGDVDHDVYQKISAYSPVPGGVGPMTVAALMENVIKLWRYQRSC